MNGTDTTATITYTTYTARVAGQRGTLHVGAGVAFFLPKGAAPAAARFVPVRETFAVLDGDDLLVRLSDGGVVRARKGLEVARALRGLGVLTYREGRVVAL